MGSRMMKSGSGITMDGSKETTGSTESDEELESITGIYPFDDPSPQLFVIDMINSIWSLKC